jgi:hypothetical protein
MPHRNKMMQTFGHFAETAVWHQCAEFQFNIRLIRTDYHTARKRSMDDLSQDEEYIARARIRQRLQQYAALFLSIILTAVSALVVAERTKKPEAYHTSILTGEGWVMELLAGHPERIRCELGVRQHVFAALVSDLRAMGHLNSKFVSLEEQLAIFLYSCVTGLTIRHVGERFQRSNETISR